MSLKLITLAALGVASQASVEGRQLGNTADTHWKGTCIMGQPSNLGGPDGPEIVVKSDGLCMKNSPESSTITAGSTTLSYLVKCDGTFLFYFPKCCLILIFHLNFLLRCFFISVHRSCLDNSKIRQG